MPYRSSGSKGAASEQTPSRFSISRRQNDSDNDTRNGRKPPSSFANSNMTQTNNRDSTSSQSSQNGVPKMYLTHRRRQSSIPNAKGIMGPRPISRDLQHKRFTSNSMKHEPSYYETIRAGPVVESQNPYTAPENHFEDDNNFSFAAIDPMATVPIDPNAQKRQESPPVTEFSEPTFNFDDFHDNIATEANINHFPMPGGAGTFENAEASAASNIEPRRVPTQTTIPVPTRKTSDAGSISRKTSSASTAGRAYISKGDPVAAATVTTASGLKGRRQSHFPPNAFNNGSLPPAKAAPRKSVGPGTFMPLDGSEQDSKRPPSMTGRKSSADSVKSGSNRTQQGRARGDSREGSKSPRANKTRSIFTPSSKQNAPNKDLLTPSRTPDPQRVGSITIQNTPGKRSGTPGRTTTPGASGKRASVMPSAVTGLGARTISPTDAKRFKRISIMPPAPPVPHRRISQAPPTPQPDTVPSARPRSTVQSPAGVRKSLTPSSSRTTPDPNRKSYSSGQSLSSSTSFNSGRNSTTATLRLSQPNLSSSRLPTPKPRTEGNNNVPAEMIPPVPAIPKSYESPASEFEQPFFPARSSGQDAIDTPVSASPTLANLAQAMAGLDFPRPYSSSSERVSSVGSHQTDFVPPLPVTSQADMQKRNLAALRLPPINLLPLSTPTAARIKSFKETKQDEISSPSTPPPATRNMKTPSTPMTASKATFFSKGYGYEPGVPKLAMRSSTSHYALRQDKSYLEEIGANLPIFSFEADDASHRSMSPFISSSLPKDGADFPHYMRPNFNSEMRRNQNQQRPNGPRAPSYSIPSKTDTPNLSSSDKSGNATPSTAIAPSQEQLSRRQGEAKLVDLSAHDSDAAKYDNMPPPKLPASATWSNLSSKVSASPSQKPGFFRSRRKTSASSTNTTPPGRQESFDSAVSHISGSRPSLESIRSSVMVHPNRSGSLLGPSSSVNSKSGPQNITEEPLLDKDDLLAEEEMKKLASKRRDLEAAARKLDSLNARARPVPRLSAAMILQSADLNIFERGEVVDYPDVYFTGTKNAKKIIGDLSSSSNNFGYDDERGDYNIIEGDHLMYRYEVVDLLGKGSFGQVVRCVDHKTGTLVAIKIIRNKKRFHQQALVEVDILKKLKEWDPDKQHNVVNFDQSFYFRGHLCISTDLLDMNLYEFIKVHDFRGFSLKLIRRFTKQILSSLVLLHSKRVIHCDLKPENILLSHPVHTDIKVIDFGSSCFENEKVYTYIQSRFYRSPEVILGMSYGMPIDMWSVGCILAELFTGYPIFPGENEQEQLACIMEVFGPPEKHLIEKSSRRKLFFDSMGKPRLTVSSKGRRRRPSSRELRQALKCDDEPFLDFISRCLRWDPVRRMNPQEALRHEFITGIKMPTAASRRTLQNPLNSPLKRGNSVTGGPARPLPQPPAAGFRAAGANAFAASPNKQAGRRQSAAVNGFHAPMTAKRASHAAMNASANGNMSKLAASQRSMSGRPDLAQAAAQASLVK